MLQTVMRSSMVMRVDRRAAVFVGVADAAIHAEAADDRQNDVLGVDAGQERAVDIDTADLQGIERQALRGEDVADLRGADAERHGAKRAVGRRVTVSAGDGHSGLRQTELGSDDMHDALVLAAGSARRPQLNAELPAVALERGGHLFGGDVDERSRLRAGRHDVVDRGERALGIRDPPAMLAQHVEGLRAGHLVNEMEADEQLGLPARQGTDGVRVPDFVKKGVHGLRQ